MSYEMPKRTHNLMGKKLKTFDLKVMPLNKFNSRPIRQLPAVRGRIIFADNVHHQFTFDIGRGATISIVEGPSEPNRNVGDVEWLDFNGVGRADHHRFWSVKLTEYLDEKYFPINFIEL